MTLQQFIIYNEVASLISMAIWFAVSGIGLLIWKHIKKKRAARFLTPEQILEFSGHCTKCGQKLPLVSVPSPKDAA